jgi:hypothetical protein
MLRRIVGMIAVIVGGTVFVYFAWTAHRFSDLWPTDWPQPFPYADRWLLALNDYYDAKYPVTGPYIKIHGEWPRVMRDVSYAMWAGGIICALGLALLLSPMVRRVVQSRKRGFEVVSRSNGGTAAN